MELKSLLKAFGDNFSTMSIFFLFGWGWVTMGVLKAPESIPNEIVLVRYMNKSGGISRV